MIVDELRDHLTSSMGGRLVADVRIGLGYTGVMVDDGHVGVAYTFRENAAPGCSVFMGRRPLAGCTAGELLEYLGSSDGVESTLGLAVANALANRADSRHHDGDILETLSIGPSDRVGMVGYFGPLVEPLEKRVRELVIFEHNAARSGRVLPAEEALVELPRCDVAVITSTALILGELDRLLEVAAACREVALVGASTPLVPEVFAARGVNLLSGIVVTDPAGILQIVSEGGGMGFFGKRIRKVNIRL
ncbi:MAG: DUF364 domain-containing protein [Thermoleophilia bacterium]|nr:DUF364 domain-containing protein [Thermoleophilia bacterium]